MSLAEDIKYDNFVWDALAANLPSSRRRGVGKFDININCPMCVSRGERRPDQFHRCGLKRNPTGLGINCFNCRFKTRWNVGEHLSQPMAAFLEALGMSDTDVKRIAHRALVIARTLGDHIVPEERIEYFEPSFKKIDLPLGARPIGELLNAGCDDPRFLQALEYLASRGSEIAVGYTYYWTAQAGDSMAGRLIIPMYFQNEIVGWTARDTTNTMERKYHADTPPDLLFNNRVLSDPFRKYVLLVEGAFDAIAIDSVGTLGAKLSDNQARWINSSGKIPILIADRDSSGVNNIEIALKQKWPVAFPRLASAGWWDADVKDVAKATELYGRLYVVKSIIATMTNDPYKIEVWSKLLI